jgi:hypothetical protein
MDTSSRPSTKTSTNGTPIASPPLIQGQVLTPNVPVAGVRPANQEKRQTLKHNNPLPPPPPPQKRNEQSGPKRTGFGLFGMFKEEDDDRDQLKRLKADNKRLRVQLHELQIMSDQMDAENERFKSSLVGERKINNQHHPDSHYSSALERLSVGLTDWTVTHFRGKSSKLYTPEMVEEIRTGLKKLSDANNLIPPSLHWVDVDLQTALTDSKFRIAFVLHVIGLHLHEKVFSPFSYEIEDFGLGYWLKRVSDEVARSGTCRKLWFYSLKVIQR